MTVTDIDTKDEMQFITSQFNLARTVFDESENKPEPNVTRKIPDYFL